MASGMVDRVRGRAASLYGSTGHTPASQPASMRDMAISLDEWASYFSFGGLTYPLIQTTMGSVDKERIAGNAIAAFQGVSSVFALIQARVQIFAQVRFQWTRFNGAMPGDLFGTQDLQVLERPWPNGHTSQLLAKMEIDNSICGNAYIVRPRKDRLARLRPDLATVALGSQYDMESPADAPDVEVAGYAYFPRSGKPEWFWPWEVCHWAPLPDPNFQFLGMSWMTPCLREIQSDALTTEHKYRFFANAATPNLAIKFDPSIGLEAVKAFKSLVENDHKGAFNAYKCVTPDTTVTMWGGERRRADQVRPGESVAAWADGLAVPGTVTHAEWQPASPIITVTTQRGRVIRTTPQHPYLARTVLKRYEYGATVLSDEQWVNAGDLRPGDLVRVGLGWATDDEAIRETPPDRGIPLPGGVCPITGCGRLAYVRGWCKKHYERWRRHGDPLGTVGIGRWSRVTELTPDQAWVIGELVGDGCFVTTTPAVAAWDAGVRARMAANYPISWKGPGLHEYYVRGVRSLVAECGLIGKRAWEKHIPDLVMGAPRKVQAAFISGLIDADGHVSDPAANRTAEIGITSTSLRLLQDAQYLLAGLGVNASVTTPSSMSPGDPVGTGRGSVRRHQGHRLIVQGNDQAATLAGLLDLACEAKASRLAEYAARPGGRQRRASGRPSHPLKPHRRHYDQVASVDVGPAEPTIGLEIAEHHTHITGGIVTHNTLYLGGGADPVPIGTNLQQLDFAVTQGHGESRLASAAAVPASWVGFSEGLQGSSLNAGNFNAQRRRLMDGTMAHLWASAAQSLESICPPPDSHANLWYDARIPAMREDAQDIATIQQLQAQTIAALVMQGFTPESVTKAVVNNDMTLLKHSGALSVQLHKPGEGPLPVNGSKPKAVAGASNGSGGGQGSAGS